MRPFRLAAASFVAALAACGDAAPRAPERTAAAWALDLESPSYEQSEAAVKALAGLAVEHGPEVTDALVAALSRTQPPPDATTFSIRLDPGAATRLGLEPLDAPDAVALDLSLVRRRLLDRGLKFGSMRADGEGRIDVILIGARAPEEAARLARDVCRRGALEFRAVYVPPRIDAAAAKAFVAWREAEIEAFKRAEQQGAPYAPSRPDIRLAREAAAAAPGGVESGAPPPSFVVIAEPTGIADTFDERIAATATGFVGSDGRARVRLSIDPARRADLTRWTTTLVGRELAVVRDGVVTERARVGVPWTTTIDVLAAGSPSVPPDEAARASADASAIALGRLPRPLAPVPPADVRSTTELLAPAFERAIVGLGPAAMPALERLAAADLPASRKTLVTRALASLRARIARREEAAREEKARAAREKEKPPEGEADPRDRTVNDPGEPPPPPQTPK